MVPHYASGCRCVTPSSPCCPISARSSVGPSRRLERGGNERRCCSVSLASKGAGSGSVLTFFREQHRRPPSFQERLPLRAKVDWETQQEFEFVFTEQNTTTDPQRIRKARNVWIYGQRRLFEDANPVRVMASGAIDVNHKDEVYDGEVPDIIDNAYVSIEFDNACRGMLDLCMFAERSNNEQEISVVGDTGKGQGSNLFPLTSLSASA